MNEICALFLYTVIIVTTFLLSFGGYLNHNNNKSEVIIRRCKVKHKSSKISIILTKLQICI